jgi:hypothetical protein
VTRYATIAQLKAWLPGPVSDSEDMTANLTTAIEAAEQAIDEYCNRRFSVDTTAVPRYFTPRDRRYCLIDDLGSTDDLVVAIDSDGDHTYADTLTINDDFLLEPLNAATDTEPWTKITITPWGSYLLIKALSSLKITGKWGWPDVPPAVTQAALIQATFNWKRKDAPFGMLEAPGVAPERISRRLDPTAETLIERLRLPPVRR